MEHKIKNRDKLVKPGKFWCKICDQAKVGERERCKVCGRKSGKRCKK